MFRFEVDLVCTLQRILQERDNPFSCLMLASEFDYRAGRIDVVATNDGGELFAFEAKLTRWKKAVHQAYRNTSLTHYSYVALPYDMAIKACRHRLEFERRAVGLCAVTYDDVAILIPAKKLTPLQPWLTSDAVEYIAERSSLTSSIPGAVSPWHPDLPFTLPLLSN